MTGKKKIVTTKIDFTVEQLLKQQKIDIKIIDTMSKIANTMEQMSNNIVSQGNRIQMLEGKNIGRYQT